MTTYTPPVDEADGAGDYTGTMRGALAIVYLLGSPNGLTTAELARKLQISWKGAWALMSRLCFVREFAVSFVGTPGEAGRWYVTLGSVIGAGGFEGRPPLK